MVELDLFYFKNNSNIRDCIVLGFFLKMKIQQKIVPMLKYIVTYFPATNKYLINYLSFLTVSVFLVFYIIYAILSFQFRPMTDSFSSIGANLKRWWLFFMAMVTVQPNNKSTLYFLIFLFPFLTPLILWETTDDSTNLEQKVHGILHLWWLSLILVMINIFIMTEIGDSRV